VSTGWQRGGWDRDAVTLYHRRLCRWCLRVVSARASCRAEEHASLTAQSAAFVIVSGGRREVVRGEHAAGRQWVGGRELGAGWGRQPVVHVGLEAAVEEEGEGKGHNEQDEDKRLHGLRAVVLIAMVPRT